MSPILSESEIYQLTAPIRQHAAQARKLSAMLGCEVKRRPDGLPIITRAMLERLEGTSRVQNDAGINWSRRA
jgi:hypothetical protein